MIVSVLNGSTQIFTTLQGEGPTAGMPAVFLRLSGCNLYCHWCDTAFTWNWSTTPFAHIADKPEKPNKWEKSRQQISLSPSELVLLLGDVKTTGRLVITGGEPLLQQKELIQLLEHLQEDFGPTLKFEVETNGTVLPAEGFNHFDVQFNVSPKLKNSRVEETKRIKPKVLSALSEREDVIFKFVVSDSLDLEEIHQLVAEYSIPSKRVFVMPEGTSAAGLDETISRVFGKQNSIQYQLTDRLHIRKNIP